MSEPLTKAIEFALTKHGDQIDKLGRPYILHPIRVAMSLVKHGYPLDVRIVGVLHDVIEDTNATPDEVRILFGDHVAESVWALTKMQDEDYWDYLRRVSDNRIARTVKAHDLIDNLLEWRLKGLDIAVRNRLEPKYRHALEYISTGQIGDEYD